MNGRYFVQNDKGYTWRVLKSAKRFGKKFKPYQLLKGDVLKLGRYIFEIKDISSHTKDKDQR
jgi:hypothetical protein